MIMYVINPSTIKTAEVPKMVLLFTLPVKDRRTNLIHLTKDGKELEERARVIANQTLKEALRGITVEELSISQEVLRKIFFNTKD